MISKLRLILAGSLLALFSTAASAQTVIFLLQDVLQSPSYRDFNIGQSSGGTGFVGLYAAAAGGASFGHLLGLESEDYSRTALQVDISSLADTNIVSAILSYDLLNGSGSSQTVTVTSYTSTGSLGYFWDAPNNLGQVSFTSDGLASNSVDVTNLLSNAVNGGADWFGLHLQGSSEFQWTYTYTGFGAEADSANLRLTVEYAPAVGAVPEPSTYGLMAAGVLFGLVAWKRVQRKAQAV